MHKALVGAYDLLEVDGRIAVVSEGCIGIEILEELDNGILVGCLWQLHHLGAEDATGEIATIWDEIDCDALCLITLVERVNDMRRTLGTKLIESLTYLVEMLMSEELIHAHIVVAPREMSG